MPKSLNKCAFIGNLGQDPEIKFMNNGGAVCNLSIACTETWKNKDTGAKEEKTEWIRLVAFRKLAEICGEYLKKGNRIYVEGKFTTDKYDKNGVDTYATKVIIDDMIMLSAPTGDRSSQTAGAAAQSNATGQPGAESAPAGDDGFSDFDDDIPF